MLSYGLVLALFLLAPGFATYAGLFAGFRGGEFQAAPPPPNSVFSFGVVGMSALFWHALWSLVLALNDGLCAHACWAAPFRPDVYSDALTSVGTRGAPLSGAEVADFLLTCLLLSAVAFFASSAAVRRPRVAEALRQPLFGLYADLAREAAANRRPGKYMMAYVLTDLEKDGAYVGYFGILENLQVGADKALAGVSLLDSDSFLLRLGPPLERLPSQRAALIERLVIGGAHIQNLAFEVVELP